MRPTLFPRLARTLSTLTLALALAPFAQERVAMEPPARPAAPIPPDDTLQRPWESEAERLIFFAVLEGAFETGIRDDAVDAILEQDGDGRYRFFVYACPICHPALNALRTYRQRPEFHGSKVRRRAFGFGLSEEERAQLLSPEFEVRHAAIRARIERWVEAYVEKLRLTEEEHERLELDMEDLRKRGMEFLRSYRRSDSWYAVDEGMESCAFCDGAVDAFERPLPEPVGEGEGDR